jgi:hypothetical protein
MTDLTVYIFLGDRSPIEMCTNLIFSSNPISKCSKEKAESPPFINWRSKNFYIII